MISIEERKRRSERMIGNKFGLGKNTGAKHWNWNGGKAKHSSGYSLILSSNNKYIYEHRVIWEKHYGKIPKGFSIHHKNGIKNDNRIENLQLVSYLEHKRLHPKSEEERKSISERFKRAYKVGRLTGLEKGWKMQRGETHSCWKKLPIDKIVSLYRNGFTINKIAIMFSVNWYVIQKRLSLYA